MAQVICKPGVERARYEHELIVELEVTLAIGRTEIESVASQNAWRTGKAVEIAMIFAPLGNFEVDEALGLRHKDDIDIAEVGAESSFAFNSAAKDAILIDLKHTAELGGKGALHDITVGLESLLHLHSVSVGGIAGGNKSGRMRTLRRLSNEQTAESTRKDKTGEQVRRNGPGHLYLREAPIAAV